jgi:uncharacterized membrane protein
MVEDRIAALERRAATLEERVRELETHRTPPIRRAAPPPAPPVAARRPAPRRDLEDVLGGSVLAWLGGFAVLAGLAFLLTLAISRGWLGEAERTLLSGGLSAALLAAGVRLRERRDRTEAALAAAAAGIAGLFGTLVVAGPVYHLVPGAAALGGAALVGALATWLALRWDAQAFAWLGLLGALSSPAAVGALDAYAIAFLAIAYAAAVAVIVWRHWPALAWAAFVTVTMQWVWWVYDQTPAHVGIVLAAFGALTAALAAGLEYRAERLEPNTPTLLVLNAAVLAAAGWDVLGSGAWLLALAVAHLALGLAGLRARAISHTLALIALGVAVVLGDAAAYTLTDGLTLALVWTAPTLLFSALLRRSSSQADALFSIAALSVQLLLAVVHVLAFEATPELLGSGATATALIGVGALALVAFAAARLAGGVVALVLDGTALAAVAYFTAIAADGLGLTVALAAEAVLLAVVLRPGGLAFAGVAAAHALVVLAPPVALLDGLADPLQAALGLLAVTVALAAATRSRAATALAALYLASTLVVSISPDHTGQMLLSVLWALAGVGTLVHGLIADERGARRAALILLAVTAGKVFLYDLSELEQLARVGSFIGFGLLLLMGAFAWQRVRPTLDAGDQAATPSHL